MIEQYNPEVVAATMPSHTNALTVQRNSVIVLRVSFNDYDLDDMNRLQEYYSKVFPNNTVCVMFDNIDIEVINDQSYRKARPCADIPYDSYNYS
jgi:hypothetical protein